MNVQHFAHQLFPILQHQCWTADTSVSPETWTSENPAQGQCAVTALVLQDFWGGALLRGQVRDQSHYWNLVSQQPLLEIDLTRVQFSDFHDPVPNPEVVDRAYLLSFPETVRRYELLKSRVSQHVHVV